MKLYVLAVRDIKADGYSQPMFAPTIGIAERSFRDAVNTEDQQSNLWKYPADFELYYLANFDDRTGKFENLEAPQSLGTGDAVKQHKRPS